MNLLPSRKSAHAYLDYITDPSGVGGEASSNIESVGEDPKSPRSR
jgi:hypothetical protein